MGRRGCRSGAWDGETGCQYDGEPVTGQGGAAGVSACGRRTGRRCGNSGRPTIRGGRLFPIARRPQGLAAFVHVRSLSLGGSHGTGSWATSGLGRHDRVPCTLLPQTQHVDVQLGRPREDGLGAGPGLLPHRDYVRPAQSATVHGPDPDPAAPRTLRRPPVLQPAMTAPAQPVPQTRDAPVQAEPTLPHHRRSPTVGSAAAAGAGRPGAAPAARAPPRRPSPFPAPPGLTP
jgi:hypothetical protein